MHNTRDFDRPQENAERVPQQRAGETGPNGHHGGDENAVDLRGVLEALAGGRLRGPWRWEEQGYVSV